MKQKCQEATDHRHWYRSAVSQCYRSIFSVAEVMLRNVACVSSGQHRIYHVQEMMIEKEIQNDNDLLAEKKFVLYYKLEKMHVSLSKVRKQTWL